jgi:hypothetical protein
VQESSDFEILLPLLNPLADPEDMPVRMSHVHLANVPRHVGWRPGDFEALLKAVLHRL